MARRTQNDQRKKDGLVSFVEKVAPYAAAAIGGYHLLQQPVVRQMLQRGILKGQSVTGTAGAWLGAMGDSLAHGSIMTERGAIEFEKRLGSRLQAAERARRSFHPDPSRPALTAISYAYQAKRLERTLLLSERDQTARTVLAGIAKAQLSEESYVRFASAVQQLKPGEILRRQYKRAGEDRVYSQTQRLKQIYRRLPGGMDDRVAENLPVWLDEMHSQLQLLRNKSRDREFVKTHRRNLDQAVKRSLQRRPIDNVIERTLGLSPVTIGDWMDRPDTFNEAAMRVVSRVKDGARVRASGDKFLRAMVKRNDDMRDLLLAPGMYKNVSGEIFDLRHYSEGFMRGLESIEEHLQIPILRINPVRLLHVPAIREAQRKAPFELLSIGQRQVFLTNSAAPLGRHLYHAGGNVYDLAGQLIAENQVLVNARFGLPHRAAIQMAGLSEREPQTAKGILGWLKEFADVGNQEQTSDIRRITSSTRKFLDPDWIPNRLAALTQMADNGGSISVAHDNLETIGRAMQRTVRPASEEAFGSIADRLGSLHAEFKFDMSSDEAVIETMMRITSPQYNKAIEEFSAQAAGSPTYFQSKLRGMVDEYIQDPGGFLGRRTFEQVQGPPLLTVDNLSQVSSRGRMDELRTLIQGEGLSLYDQLAEVHGGATGAKLFNELKQSPNTKQDIDRLRELWAFSHHQNQMNLASDFSSAMAGHRKVLEGYGTSGTIFEGIDLGSADAEIQMRNQVIRNMTHAFSSDLRSNPDVALYQDTVKAIVNKANPWWGEATEAAETNLLGDQTGWLSMSRSSKSMLKGINDAIRTGDTEELQGFFGQFGLGLYGTRAGRGNLRDVNPITLAAYHSMNRLNDMLSSAGIGLSVKNLGSTQDIYANLIGRRLLLPAVAIMGLKYLDYETEKVTGVSPADKVAEAYANMTIGVAKARDVLGITDWAKRKAQVHPGVEHLMEDSPWGMLLKHGSFGLLGGSKSAEELQDYYEHGFDPIRRGRWWPVGGTGAFYGGRTEYFAPNWYRRLRSNWQYTDTLYGSKDEYWAHSWMPTPTNPLAPLRHFVTDARWLEEKHKDDRPYPVSGGFPEFEAIPILGPTLDKVATTVLKPRRVRPGLARAHRDYLRALNDHLRSAGDAKAGVAYILPGGDIQTRQVPEDDHQGTLDTVSGTGSGLAPTSGLEGRSGGIPYGERITVGPGPSGGAGSGGSSGGGRAAVQSINQGIRVAGAISPRQLRALNTRNPADLFDPDVMENLSSVQMPGSISSMMGGTWYSMTEIAGIYGYMATQIMPVPGDFRGPAITRLASSKTIGSPTRLWWDQRVNGMDPYLLLNMGINAPLSELYRRFLPKPPSGIEEYNPIRNTMPAWLPGPGEMRDFLFGDPYAKIPGGEYRLPGAAYESMHNLHSDQMFGRYGAVDRFLILADVAPYSDQYRMYRDIMSSMNEAGNMPASWNKEVQAAKKRVSQIHKRYELYPRQFGNSEIIRRTVTVTDILDNNTFMARDEFGSTPLRLAGVSFASGNDERGDAAAAWLQQYIHPGARIEVGYAEDPTQLQSGDTLNTIRVAVYDRSGAPIAKKAIEEGIGKEKETDFSPAGIHARFSANEIRSGKGWENFSHLDTPLHNKFLHVRSALEEYERKIVFGREFQTWEHPLDSYLIPTIKAYARHNPLVAGALGAGLGSLFGRTRQARMVMGLIGGTITATLASLRSVREHLTGKTYKPKARRQVEDIDAYFDAIAYMKYSGLSEHYARKAKYTEGTDIAAIEKEAEDKKIRVSRTRRQLEAAKRQFKTWSSTLETGARIAKDANRSLNEIMADREIIGLGPNGIKALQYKQMAASTMAGVDPFGPMVNLMRAVPARERDFLPYFLNAPIKERDRILELVPDGLRRVLKARWGMGTRDKPSMENFFRKHYLPPTSWEGWGEHASLEAIKVKVIKEEGLDMAEFGYYPEDERRAESLDARAVDPHRPSLRLQSATSDIRKILHGVGVHNAKVDVSYGPSSGNHQLKMQMDLQKDREQDILAVLNRYGGR